ncbi:MAG: ABC transporter permease [Candidatus Coatesbacteria bacterium]|nr:ABC transporter permease [Candidatus Coatesbacteria bacterium]
MGKRSAFWAILRKDLRAYYFKPPNISWGLVFPLAWTLMFFLRSGGELDIVRLLPGVTAMSILFGTTSMLAVTITFERRVAAFDRLLLAPLPLEGLMLAKLGGAVLFGVLNSAVPLGLGFILTDVGPVQWLVVGPAILLIAFSAALVGLFVAVSVSEVFEAQTFSNFLRFPMLFLCGLFLPLAQLPVWLRPLSYALPLTYGVDALRGGLGGGLYLPLWLDFTALSGFCVLLFLLSLRNIKRHWIL